MKIYEIIDDEEKLSIGCLLYYEKEDSYIIELQDYLDEWTAPLLFANTVKKGTFTIGRELSRLWVSERVIPSGRQNIDSILANAKMQRYDERILLEKTKGICSQDSMFIEKRKELPDFVKKRMAHNLVECVPCDEYSLLCFFNDGTVRKVLIESLPDYYEGKKIRANETLFLSAHIAAGGYCVTFNDSIDIDAKVLYESGTKIPVSLNDFLSFTRWNVIDTTESCSILDCSRQNLSNYVVREKLVPIKKDVKGNLYTKGNIYRRDEFI